MLCSEPESPAFCAALKGFDECSEVRATRGGRKPASFSQGTQLTQLTLQMFIATAIYIYILHDALIKAACIEKHHETI